MTLNDLKKFKENEIQKYDVIRYISVLRNQIRKNSAERINIVCEFIESNKVLRFYFLDSFDMLVLFI